MFILQLIIIIGTHTIAIVKGRETYETFKTGLKPVLDDINELLHNPVININDKSYTLDIFLGGDYKVLTFHYTCNTVSENNSHLRYLIR